MWECCVEKWWSIRGERTFKTKNALLVMIRSPESHAVVPPSEHGPNSAIHQPLNILYRPLDTPYRLRRRSTCGGGDDEPGDVVEVGMCDGETAVEKQRISCAILARCLPVGLSRKREEKGENEPYQIPDLRRALPAAIPSDSNERHALSMTVLSRMRQRRRGSIKFAFVHANLESESLESVRISLDEVSESTDGGSSCTRGSGERSAQVREVEGNGNECRWGKKGEEETDLRCLCSLLSICCCTA